MKPPEKPTAKRPASPPTSFWRNNVIDPMLDEQTLRSIDEQVKWIVREPANPTPYVHLSALYRTQNRREEALGLLLEAIRLDSRHLAANIALCEMYCVVGDYAAAWRHARRAETGGDSTGVELLQRHRISEPRDAGT